MDTEDTTEEERKCSAFVEVIFKVVSGYECYQRAKYIVYQMVISAIKINQGKKKSNAGMSEFSVLNQKGKDSLRRC